MLLAGSAHADLVIPEGVDGTLPGGQPKWVELQNTSPASAVDVSAHSPENCNGGSLTLGGGCRNTRGVGAVLCARDSAARREAEEN